MYNSALKDFFVTSLQDVQNWSGDKPCKCTYFYDAGSSHNQMILE